MFLLTILIMSQQSELYILVIRKTYYDEHHLVSKPADFYFIFNLKGMVVSKTKDKTTIFGNFQNLIR